MQYQKVKSVAKDMMSKGPSLQKVILNTLKTCSDLVGATLGPGGQSVVIERQEENMPPIITKDGVTVFRALGFDNPAAHVLMEAARDASIRTASEAGDGTTTATILAESIVSSTMKFCNKNPSVSPQRVVGILRDLYRDDIVPEIEAIKFRPTLDSVEGHKMLRGVAKVSANGDDALADAVMKCFDIIGSEGNVTIVEVNGPSKYEVQKIEGYPIGVGFEDSCGPFYQKFVNDPGSQSCILERPSFILYHGRINDYNMLYPVLSKIAIEVSNGAVMMDNKKLTHNVVVVANGFSESVLANMAAAFVMEGTLNVVPLVVPMSPLKTGQYDFLMDIASLTGAQILDPLEGGFQNFTMESLGIGISGFESTRFRSNIIGYRDELLVFERVDQINKQLSEVALSELDKRLLRERLAKLTHGIARLVVSGSSVCEMKERRDRAEDAVCAVRGAIKHGALPGGGAFLHHMSTQLVNLDHGDALKNRVAVEVLSVALMAPVYRLFMNAGYTETEAKGFTAAIKLNNVVDLFEQKSVDPVVGGILDSVPAVREAIGNSISIASLLGTCGGTVVFQRDHQLELNEAKESTEFLRNTNVNEANERG